METVDPNRTETRADIIALEMVILTEGRFLGAVLQCSASYAFTLSFFLLIQWMAALGLFFLGLAAVKSGMIATAAHPKLRSTQHWGLVPGIALGLIGAAIRQWGPPCPASS